MNIYLSTGVRFVRRVHSSRDSGLLRPDLWNVCSGGEDADEVPHQAARSAGQQIEIGQKFQVKNC